jgi:hypothetical protein
MDGNRDKHCDGDVAIKYCGCCHLCAEVKSFIKYDSLIAIECDAIAIQCRKSGTWC